MADMLGDSFAVDDPMSMRPGGPAELMRTSDEEVNRSRELFMHAYSQQLPWAAQGQNDDLFRNGAQWTEEQINVLKERGQSPSVINVTYQAVETAKSLMTTNAPKWRATGREDSDSKMGHLMSRLLDWIWYINEGKKKLKIALDDAYVRGRGVWVVYWNPDLDSGNGDVGIDSVYPAEVFPDPNSRDPHWSDAAYVLISRLMTRWQVSNALGESVAASLTDAMRDEFETNPTGDYATEEDQVVGPVADPRMKALFRFIDRYEMVKLPRYRSVGPEPNKERTLTEEEFEEFMQMPVIRIVAGGQPSVITDPNMVAQIAGWLEVAYPDSMSGVMHQRQDGSFAPGEATDPESIEGSEFEAQLASIAELVQTGEVQVKSVYISGCKRVVSIGHMPVFVGVLPVDRYPIVPFVSLTSRNPYPMSEVRMVRSLQQRLNKTDSLLLAHLASSSGVKAFVPRGSVDRNAAEAQLGKAGFGLIEYDPELGAVTGFQPIQLASQMYMEEARIQETIQGILGVYSSSQGDPDKMPDTYKGGMMHDEFTTRRMRSKLDDMEAALMIAGRIAIQFAQVYYPVNKVIRMVEPSGESRSQNVNQPLYDTFGNIVGLVNDITVGRYDIEIVGGSTLPTSRQGLMEYYLALYQAGIIDQVEVLKKTEVFDVESVLERFSMMTQLQSQNAQLQEEVKRLKGDLQTAFRETVQANQRVLVEKARGKITESVARTQAAETLFKQRLGDIVQLEKQLKRNGKATSKPA